MPLRSGAGNTYRFNYLGSRRNELTIGRFYDIGIALFRFRNSSLTSFDRIGPNDGHSEHSRRYSDVSGQPNAA